MILAHMDTNRDFESIPARRGLANDLVGHLPGSPGRLQALRLSPARADRSAAGRATSDGYGVRRQFQRPHAALEVEAAAAANWLDSRPRVSSIWVRPVRESLGEKAMLGLLVAGAAAGVAYGLACLLDLVQNWAVVNQGIGRMLQ